jgi:glycosyltransferase involved in cell wall biosynthesis
MRRIAFHEEERGELLQPEQVAREVISLLKREDITGNTLEVRKELGKRARRTAETYSWDRIAANYEEVFVDLVDSRSKRHG